MGRGGGEEARKINTALFGIIKVAFILGFWTFNCLPLNPTDIFIIKATNLLLSLRLHIKSDQYAVALT